MNSPVIKRSIVINDHKTSVSLEDAFWNSLKDLALRQHITLSKMVGEIDLHRRNGNLSSAIRLFVLENVRSQISQASGNRVEANAMFRVGVQDHG